MTLPACIAMSDTASMRRKGEQAGSLVRSGKSWHARYRTWTAGTDGKAGWRQVQERIGPCIGPDRLTRAQAEDELKRLVGKANGPSAITRNTATIEQFWQSRFKPDCVDKRTKSTKIHYTYVWENHLREAIGPMRFGDVTLSVLQTIINAKAERFEARTVRHIAGAVRAIFNHAQAHGVYLGANPYSRALRLPPIPETAKRVLTREKLELLCATITPRHRALVYCLGMLGLRISEALGLKWEYVNLSDVPKSVEDRTLPPRSIWVRWNYTKGEWGTLKNKPSSRVIPLTTHVVEVLRWHQTHTPTAETVWANEDGGPLDANNIQRRHLKPAGAKVGCAWVSWHSFRYTQATLADGAGVTSAGRQRVLGHATDRMTQHYTQADVELVRAQLEAIDVPAEWAN